MSKLSNVKNLIFEKRLFQRRLITAIVIVVLLSFILLIRLIGLQVFSHNLYATLSRHNYLTLLPIEPNRGLIYDRNGVLIAENLPVFSLDIIPDRIENLGQTLAALKQIINFSPTDIEQFNKSLLRHSVFEPVPLKLKLTEDEVARFYVNQYKFPGVMVDARMIRNYPLGAAMSSVLGYVGRINAQELSQVDSANYRATNFIGKSGVEKYYEQQLHGTVGYQQVEVDASGRPLRVVQYIPPVAGENLYLTVDSKLQAAAIKALGQERGAVVVIEPKTGKVLALVSNPSFDPNLFVQGISHKDYNELRDSPDRPMYNRAIRGRFPMASTIKPFLALEGLDSKVITSNYTIYDPGWFKLPNTMQIYRNWKHSGHGNVDVTKAIIVSCDTFFYNLAVMLGIDKIDDILNRFGFGSQTGIDMVGEVSGLIPSPAWKRRAQGVSWYTGDTVISGIGQGFVLTTPLQLAAATATLANRGLRIKPHLIKQQPVMEDPVMIRDKTVWDVVIKAMQGVINQPEGTARIRFGIQHQYSVAAKSGTGQIYSKHARDENERGNTTLSKRLRDHSLFIAFAPVKHPKLAVAVVVENSAIAGTVARKVLDYYLVKKHETIQSSS